jgi:hypothetical protein
MTDNIGYGKQKRREGNLRVLAGEQTFRYLMFISRHLGRKSDPECHRRDAFREMLDSVAANGHTFDECEELLRNCAFTNVFLRDGALEV